MNAYHYAKTQELQMLNDFAVRAELNRAVTDECVELLDPDGVHVLAETYVLDDGQTYRMMWMLKLTNSDEPTIVFIDATPETYEAVVTTLPTETLAA